MDPGCGGRLHPGSECLGSSSRGWVESGVGSTARWGVRAVLPRERRRCRAPHVRRRRSASRRRRRRRAGGTRVPAGGIPARRLRCLRRGGTGARRPAGALVGGSLADQGCAVRGDRVRTTRGGGEPVERRLAERGGPVLLLGGEPGAALPRQVGVGLAARAGGGPGSRSRRDSGAVCVDVSAACGLGQLLEGGSVELATLLAAAASRV